MQGTICAANASLISTTSMSLIDMPVSFSSFLDRRDRAEAHDLRADRRDGGGEDPRFRLQPELLARSSEMISSAAAPSLSGQALPAVTVPSSLNTGFSAASFSIVVPGRGPSSLVTTVSGTSISLPSLSVVLVRRHRHGDDLRVEVPGLTAATARVWEISAHSSWASRLTLQRSATFSAVMPIGM